MGNTCVKKKSNKLEKQKLAQDDKEGFDEDMYAIPYGEHSGKNESHIYRQQKVCNSAELPW